ncbi:MAG: CusA/CzcA family heavy metal efflux RND transporter [Flavobacteriaceae bacterium]|nr:CusA/CzcA family heavy metal efflux RND transporter [Flavobacteriaceae bacterium]
MLSNIINFSIKNKFIVLLFTSFIVGFGVYSLTQIPIGAVPDVTNNQVQVITTSQNLSTQDIEQFITYPVELEMANIPGVVEIRSISKFGLSVVTIVFEESIGTYLPRQLIAEKLTSVREKIPEGFGSPEMGPITTGLGEIYQYVLDVKEDYKGSYSATELRTIQDWIVKRQLSGIKGVVEVNTWGGFLKQYEVAINTSKLNAMDITASEVFTALNKNNSVAGGGYIEKTNQAYFIRGEGLITSLEDIRNIVVKTKNGLPILIKDIAKVGFGSAMRFGAITANGEGEKVLGQVMMLKDGNSKQVIEAVKERVKSIEKSLPEGVYINGFLDRSELIEKTTFTVYENLILGSLIVIFIVVLLLGDWRSGLVVASVIPLALMFTLSMMYLFGVDANLMSLGAIDFGIIIDGAVIIVEFVAFKITSKSEDFKNLTKIQAQDVRDDVTFGAASKMMSSAIFGQIIILIVFIPILTLGGVEGKMFKPMAMTFSFALIGAMIFGLTYVPAMASMVIKPVKLSDKNISKRLMRFLTNLYEPSIRWALKSKQLVISASVVILLSSFYLFSTMGAEFVPTLDEGDFVIQPILKTGTSLKKTVEITTKIEQILKQFPEVKQVVSRIGAAEVPTDPMSMEESDVIVTLIPKGEWTTAKTKDELADKFKEALEIIPNMEVEFTQPIEMRFNELISGVRSDIAIKIYGDNLDLLNKKANEIKKAISHIEGAADITVEKTAGLPQMNVKFNRSKIARYGLNISDLNEMITMGFSGHTAGSIFEGEKKFDLVLRLDKNNRQDISDLQNLYVDTPSGVKIPLSELATISYTKGAAKISRDNTRRRVVVGVNVRNRDLQSVVDDLKATINKEIKIPVGYSITYGGQFENLESAKARLAVAVPIALILIFILLYFAFKSVKEAFIIYSAIPFAAVGGILFLWLRDLPFSISAGVGFIALFGIAVLNGIVLIEEFKELKHNGMKTDDELIIFGAKSRLRAVLLTALAAALGFLPMAISNGAGAEVQRPLATVVIGGLITSTLLTLLVLPILYSIFDNRRERKRFHLKSKKGQVVTTILVLFTLGINAQTPTLGLEELKQLAFENNTSLKVAALKAEKANALISSSLNFDKTEVYYSYDENNIAFNNEPLNVFGIQQSFLFPTVYFAAKKIGVENQKSAAINHEIQKKIVESQIMSNYYEYLFSVEKEKIYFSLDSLYSNFAKSAARRFELGETNYLEKITAQSKQKKIQTQLEKATQDVEIALKRIKKTVQSEEDFEVKLIPINKLFLQEKSVEESPELAYFKSQEAMFKAKNNFEKQQLLPDISLEYFQGTNSTLPSNLYGFQVGLKIPLLFSGQSSQIKASKIAFNESVEQSKAYKFQLEGYQQELYSELYKNQKALEYYETEGTSLSYEILKTANSSFKNGEIDFFRFIQSIENAYEIKIDYLINLNQLNQTIIKLNHLTL